MGRAVIWALQQNLGWNEASIGANRVKVYPVNA